MVIKQHCKAKTPFIVVGNTPITKSYYGKVDHLKRSGIIQGFWSINPRSLDNNGGSIKETPFGGFCKFDLYGKLQESAVNLLREEREFFSSIQNKKELGEIIELANKEVTYEEKAQKFLQLLRESR
ncbi:MAG: hypothetical protein N2558_03655 [Patescibacteria group bacterium]|nr:hypothetical protein [Patescibacteria group bacterium]